MSTSLTEKRLVGPIRRRPNAGYVCRSWHSASSAQRQPSPARFCSAMMPRKATDEQNPRACTTRYLVHDIL